MKIMRWPVILIGFGIAVVLLLLGMAGRATASSEGSGGGSYLQSSSLPPGTAPFFYIVSVAVNTSVTIESYNFPANDEFIVWMGPLDTAEGESVQVTQQSSGDGGSFTATYNIPNSLKGAYRIAVRLESPSSGYYAYNWFYNDDDAGRAGGPKGSNTPSPTPLPTTQPPTAVPTSPAAATIPATQAAITLAPLQAPTTVQANSSLAASGGTNLILPDYPYFFIEAVVVNQTVTIKGYNFPAKDKFNVTMGLMGTRGINGIPAGEYSTEKVGQFTATFNIPAALHDLKQISIRLESPTSRYYAFNWFYNNTTNPEDPEPTPAPEVPFTPAKPPVFFIDSVVLGKTVTITTYNFPANDDFKVTMGYMGTQGIGGYVIGTQSSGPGGSFSVTYTIPAELANQPKISIRLQSPTSGYYAYNWFHNNTTTP